MLMLFIILFVHLGFVGSMNNNVCMQTEELSCFQLRGLKRVAKQGASVFICRDLQAICLGTTGSQAEMKKPPFLFPCRDTLFSLKQNIQPQTSLFRPFGLENKHRKKLNNEGLDSPHA